MSLSFVTNIPSPLYEQADYPTIAELNAHLHQDSRAVFVDSLDVLPVTAQRLSVQVQSQECPSTDTPDARGCGWRSLYIF